LTIERFSSPNSSGTRTPARHFRFRLLDEQGNDLGPLATKRGTWQQGEQLSRWHGDDLEVVRVVPTESHEPIDGFLVVKRR
jgi:hypothetical protein